MKTDENIIFVFLNQAGLGVLEMKTQSKLKFGGAIC